MSSEAFFFCDKCQDEVRCHRTTTKQHSERRNALSSSSDGSDATIASQLRAPKVTECATERGSCNVNLRDETSEKTGDIQFPVFFKDLFPTSK